MRYTETRTNTRHSTTTLMADVVRHFYARQHLGKAVVLCDDPAEMLGVARKQWLKLSRTLQQRRGQTTNAVEILKYTYTITQMQQTHFADQAPQEQPEAHLFFVRPGQALLPPLDCFTLYVTTAVPGARLRRLATELPASALVVDYSGRLGSTVPALKPKVELERQVAAGWREVTAFLAKQGVDAGLFGQKDGRSDRLDDAVDAVLEVDVAFMNLANQFQRRLDLARPLKTISKAERDQYETFLMLALRVQTLTPSGFTAKFLGTYADDTFYFSEQHRPHETLAEEIARHQAAGRLNLARALLRQRDAAADAGGKRLEPVRLPGRTIAPQLIAV